LKLKSKDIAKALGVSTATVSLAINDKPGVNPETKREILEYISRLLQLLNRKIPINRVIYAFMGIFLFFGM
jgi:LacI family transcriptional regulator